MPNRTAMPPTQENGARLAEIAFDLTTTHNIIQETETKICSLHHDAFEHCVRAGHLLIEAKKLCGHGNFRKWAKQNTNLSKSSVTNYLKLATNEEYLRAKMPTVGIMTVGSALELVQKLEAKKKRKAENDNSENRPAMPFETSTTVWDFKTKDTRDALREYKKTYEDGVSGTREGAMCDDPNGIYPGTYSVFHPALVLDVLQRWSQPGHVVLDPFAGGPARGLVCAEFGCRYHGFDVRPDQIEDNRVEMEAIGYAKDVKYHVGDARKIASGPKLYDFALTCPPYFNLEVYSDLPEDLSTLPTYGDFQDAMKEVAKAIYKKMKPGAFVCLVVGNFREPNNHPLIDFRGHTVVNMQEAGFFFWEEVVVDRPKGTAAVRASNAWINQKLVRTHEYVLVFRKPGWTDCLETIPVKVSAKSARLNFIQCGPECIEKKGCKGNCCDAPTEPTGCMITVDPSEEEKIKAHGVEISNGLIQPKLGCKGCPFKKNDGLCSLHGTDDKPFGCIASPFKFNKNGTLVIRNRYKFLPTYDRENGKPAYQVFRASLDKIFGEEQAAAICQHLDSGGGDYMAEVSKEVWDKMAGREAILHTKKKHN